MTEQLTRSQISDFAKTMTPADFAYFLESRCNSFTTDYRQGREVGQNLHMSHHTLQASVFRYLLGIVVGIGEQEARLTDARNETAVFTAKKIQGMISTGELELGYMI